MTIPTSTATQLTIMKTDKLGRIQTPPEQREARLDALGRSGMTDTELARLHGIMVGQASCRKSAPTNHKTPMTGVAPAA